METLRSKEHVLRCTKEENTLYPCVCLSECISDTISCEECVFGAKVAHTQGNSYTTFGMSEDSMIKLIDKVYDHTIILLTMEI